MVDQWLFRAWARTIAQADIYDQLEPSGNLAARDTPPPENALAALARCLSTGVAAVADTVVFNHVRFQATSLIQSENVAARAN